MVQHMMPFELKPEFVAEVKVMDGIVGNIIEKIAQHKTHKIQGH
jgi:hypothetical protein